jgi:hypothetical protein
MRHWTQSPPARSQTGSVALQSLLWPHCEHWLVTPEQMGRAGGQPALVRQPTQVRLVGSQTGDPALHWVLLVQAVSHWPLAGEHPWPAAQSDAERQATHAPSTQKGALGLQSVSLAHWAQPTPVWHPLAHGSPPTEHPPLGRSLPEWHEAPRSPSAKVRNVPVRSARPRLVHGILEGSRARGLMIVFKVGLL